MINDETINRLLCEKIVNQTWSTAANFREEIEQILDKSGPISDRDISLLIIAATAFVQKDTLIELEDLSFSSL